METSPKYPVLHKETILDGISHGEKARLLDHDFTPRLAEPSGFYQQIGGPSKPSAPPLFTGGGQPWHTMSSTLPEEPKSVWLGPCLAFMSGTFFTLGATGVKALKGIDPMELLVVRSILQMCVMIPIAIYTKQNLFGPKGHRILLQLQGIVGGVTLVLLFFTFRRLPLGDATAIIFSSPVFVMVLSFIVLREPCGFFRTFIVCLLLLGVILIAKPPFIFQFFVHADAVYDLLGYTAAILATLFTALNIVIMRKCKDVHYSVVVLSLSVWSLVSSGGLLVASTALGEVFNFPDSLREWVLTALVSSLGLMGQILVARALGLEGAGKVSVIRSLDIILAFILQVLVFNELPDWMSAFGATAVLICVVGMTFEPKIKQFFKKIP